MGYEKVRAVVLCPPEMTPSKSSTPHPRKLQETTRIRVRASDIERKEQKEVQQLLFLPFSIECPSLPPSWPMPVGRFPPLTAPSTSPRHSPHTTAPKILSSTEPTNCPCTTNSSSSFLDCSWRFLGSQASLGACLPRRRGPCEHEGPLMLMFEYALLLTI